MDTLDIESRKKLMSKIKNKNTKPEIIVRSLLHKLGFRYRLHRSDLPGKPDIVLQKYKAVILVHGCFWHSHENCNKAKRPTSNVKFWQNKLDKNKYRDNVNESLLLELGWSVFVVWECQTTDLDSLATRLITFLANTKNESPISKQKQCMHPENPRPARK